MIQFFQGIKTYSALTFFFIKLPPCKEICEMSTTIKVKLAA